MFEKREFLFEKAHTRYRTRGQTAEIHLYTIYLYLFHHAQDHAHSTTAYGPRQGRSFWARQHRCEQYPGKTRGSNGPKHGPGGNRTTVRELPGGTRGGADAKKHVPATLQ